MRKPKAWPDTKAALERIQQGIIDDTRVEENPYDLDELRRRYGSSNAEGSRQEPATDRVKHRG